MTWPVPAPGDISNRAAAVYEQALPGIDARNPNTVATTNTRITELAMQDLYFFQANVAQEMFPDTAVQNLPRIAAEWGVPRVQASAAAGNVIVNVLAGARPVALPANIPMSYQGQSYVSTAAVTVAAGVSSASVPVQASVTGAAGNLPADTPLTITSPVAGLTSQTAAVDSNGLTGGADLQSLAAWAAAIIQKIRYQPSGGDYQDYVDWAEAALPDVLMAACPPGACGGGVVSVVFIMDGFVVPTDEQIAAVLAYINGPKRRPVTAQVNVYAATLNPVNITLHLNPDTPAIRAAATAALALSFQQDATIGGTTYLSRLNNAVSSSDGEYSHEMIAPTADVAAPSLFALNTLGTVTFE